MRTLTLAFGESIIRGPARPNEIQCDAVRISPEIELLGRELATLINPDDLRQADMGTTRLKSIEHINGGRCTAHPHHGAKEAPGIDHRQHPESLAYQ